MKKFSKHPLNTDLLFLLGNIVSFLLIMSIMRGLLLYYNLDLAKGIPIVDLVRSFLVGIRFDLIVACIISIPLVLSLLLPNGLGNRKLAKWWLVSTGAISIFISITELEFYREFHTRLNSIAFHYIQEDVGTVSSMIWHGFPVIRLLLLWLVISLIYVYLIHQVHKLAPAQTKMQYPFVYRIPIFLIVLALVVVGGRGTLRHGPPLRWGDAFHSQSLFANHLALNSVFTLVKAATQVKKNKGKEWLKVLPDETATAVVRQLLLTPQDELIDEDKYPILRRHTPIVRLNKPPLNKPPQNVVLIIMESFSGAFTGAFGNQDNITPEFDKLAKEGLLFDHFFSNGTHTHQGMFATVGCFPNLPGYEYLMQTVEGQNQFSGLPVLLNAQGLNNLYVYNGHFAWDNQEGFFRNQGMTRFIGRDDFKNPVFIDPTWGVSDQDMFDGALVELNQLPKDKPFYAVLQTLSNHTPFALPEKLPVKEVTGFNKLNQHLTAQRYSDWALGRFFDEAKKTPWYKDTVFVILGDHGFSTLTQLSDIDLLRFRVPLLIMGSGISEKYGSVAHHVGSQVDVAPTIASILGKPFVSQCWGRDLLSLTDDDPGIAMIKPSGSDQTVAFITGEEMLIMHPDKKSTLGRYSLTDPSYEIIENEPRNKELTIHLKAYIQAAMKGLLDNNIGVPGNYTKSRLTRQEVQ